MADEIMTAPEEQALFQLSNGRYIMDEAQSRVMFQIKEAQPEHSHPISGTGYSWDESGMAELFSECYKNDTRYCPEAKSWFTYSEGAWRKDTGSLLVAEKIKEFCRLMALYCGEIANEERRSEYMKFIVKMGDRRFRDRLMKDAASVLPIASAEFDANPYLINCKNGTFDLEKMKFREHDWKDFLTMQTNFDTPCRTHGVAAGRSSLQRSLVMTKTRLIICKRRWGTPCWVWRTRNVCSFSTARPLAMASPPCSRQFTTFSVTMLPCPPCRSSARQNARRTPKQRTPCWLL